LPGAFSSSYWRSAFFITPALVGGPRDLMIAVLIQQQVDLFNWPFASALAVVLLAAALIVFAVFEPRPRCRRCERIAEPKVRNPFPPAGSPVRTWRSGKAYPHLRKQLYAPHGRSERWRSGWDGEFESPLLQR
jgi:hypothetical protein